MTVIFENPDTMESYLSFNSYENYQSLVDSHNLVSQNTKNIFNFDSSTNTLKLRLNEEKYKYNLLKTQWKTWETT